MTPVLCLLVIVGVEVDVMQDDGVGGCQVDAKAPGTCGQEEDEDVWVFIELVNQSLPAQAETSRKSVIPLVLLVCGLTAKWLDSYVI